MKQSDLKGFTSWLGKRSYKARLERFGLERLQEIARENGKLGVKYSYHNFYVKLLRKLLDLGFIEKDVLIWDEKRKKTEAVYQLKLQPIPERGPQGGFVKQAWHLAKGWNDLVRVQ